MHAKATFQGSCCKMCCLCKVRGCLAWLVLGQKLRMSAVAVEGLRSASRGTATQHLRFTTAAPTVLARPEGPVTCAGPATAPPPQSQATLP